MGHDQDHTLRCSSVHVCTLKSLHAHQFVGMMDAQTNARLEGEKAYLVVRLNEQST